MAKLREQDLAHGADHDRFGRAILKCEGFTPNCVYSGRCELSGQCFASPAHLVAARLVETLIPTDGRAGVHLAYLKRVAEMLRHGEVCL